MATNLVPFSDNPLSLNTPDDTRAGNFFKNDSTANGYDDGYAVSGSTSYSSSQLYLTPVGAYGSAMSYYGAYDMGGNVFEWNETTIGSDRGIRGGSWNYFESELQSSFRNNDDPTLGDFNIGFRLAGVIPEPGRMVLIALGGVGVLMQRRSR